MSKTIFVYENWSGREPVLLGRTDGEEDVSYLDLADFIRSNGANPKADLKELWKRIVFSMAVTNSDDHLRNHGFLYAKNGWRLSPLYDVNPVPFGDSLSLNISEDDPTIDINLAMETAHYYDLSLKEAEETAAALLETVRTNWERSARENGLNRGALEQMRPAFRACS